MSQTIVAVYDSVTNAQQAAQAVIAAGVDRNNIRLSQQSGAASSGGAEDKGFWDSLKDAFGFGEDDDRYGYREAARRGNTVLSVTADDQQTDQVVSILQNYNAINLDEKASGWGNEGWSGYSRYEGSTASDASATAVARGSSSAQAGAARTAATGQAEAIPVVEEQLRVGKRAVNGGGIRIHSRVTERPVEENVTLRQEHVNVERRPVDRPLTDADRAAAFQERTVEATAHSEQAVVAKDARVVEEVMLNKDVEQKTQTVRDTVKRTDVDVERLEADERARPVYEFADELSQNEQYRGKDWASVETDVRRSFEQRHPQSKWDEYKDTIRSRYSRSSSPSNR